MRRRVVISGVGVVSPMGVGVDALWEGLLEGRSAIGPATLFDASGFRSTLVAEIRDFRGRDFVPKSYRKAVKVMARDIELAVAAAKLAVEDAKVATKGTLEDAGEGAEPTYSGAQIGCHIGAGLIATDIDELTSALATARGEDGRFDIRKWGEGALGNLQPLWLLKYLPNMLACHVTIIHDARAPSNTITCAEASGALSIGESMRVIERGDAVACFSGGAESKLNPMGLLRMDLLGRLADTRDAQGEPWSLIRPYDPGATGGLLGEAGAILLLEEAEAAKARGVEAYCELAGFGAGHSPRSDDPARRSLGLVHAITRALEDAGVSPDEVDAIVPHAAGVPSLDEEERAALERVFGERVSEIPLVTTTPNIGEAMAGAGGLAASVGALCLRHQGLPARLHAGNPAETMRAGRSAPRDARLRTVLVCTNALGGQNAALVLRRL